MSDRTDQTPATLEPLQAALGDRYRLERELGGGGMARVFLATETALERRVVIKLLPDALAAGLSADRFAREIRLAAQLQAAHIVPVLTTGATSDGIPYYTMPFVPGDSLRARLQAGPVAPDDAIRILRDVAEALEYAHAQGVVHRDIKPENILLNGRTAVVTDFGIAKAITAARGEETTAGATLTSVGVSLGTPAYMAPEQATGDTVDHRADLYAWGLLAYELLAGAHPFAGKTSTQQLVTAQITEQPAPLDTKRPGLPLPLAALVMQCLEKEPIKRPADATAVLAALAALGSGAGLAATTGGTTATTAGGTTAPNATPTAARGRAVTLAVALLAVLGVGGAWLTKRGAASPAAAETGPPGLAVLPFEHQGDSADVYLTEGITDEIRGKLSTVRELLVIARGSAVQYRGTTKRPQQIAEELGVRWLLTGTVQVIGSGEQRRVIVRPELVEITAGGKPQSRWGQPFDAIGADVLTLQGQVATKVVDAIALPGSAADRARIVAVPTRDPVAYDLLLKARAATNFGLDNTTANVQRAERLLVEAVRRDSLLLDGWSDLAVTQANLYMRRPSPPLAAAAKRSAERALQLDPDGALGARAMMAYSRSVNRDPQRARAEAERAMLADPSDSRMAGNVAVILHDAGQYDESIRVMETAMRRDPRSVSNLVTLVGWLMLQRRFDAAQTYLARLDALAPTGASAVQLRLIWHLFQGDTAGARRAASAGRQRIPEEQFLAGLAQQGTTWLVEPNRVRQFLAGGLAVSQPDDRWQWWVWHADQAWLERDTVAMRAWADSARVLLAGQTRSQRDDFYLRLSYADVLAIGGRADEAVREAREAIATMRRQNPTNAGGIHGEMLLFASTIAATAGRLDDAMTWLEEEQQLPSAYPAAYLRVNPWMAPLRGHPRFERILAAQSKR